MRNKNYKKNKREWGSPSLLAKLTIFIDGVTRSGKSMLGPVVSSLTRTYPMQHQTFLDNLLPIYAKKSITLDAFKSLLNFYFNKNLYYLNISREINLRPNDNSSLVNNKDFKKYLKNLNRNEGDYVIKEIKKKNHYPVYMTHDLLSMVNDFNKLNYSYKLLHICRHPIDNIFSFFKRYQLRLSSKANEKYNLNDPRIHSMMIKINGILLPHYAMNAEKKFIKYNFMEKVVFYYLNSINNSIKSYKKLKTKQKKKILIIKYDDFAEKTNLEVKKISNFLNIKKTSHTQKILKMNNLPRKMNPNERDYKFEEIKKNISKNLYKQVLKIKIKYEQSKLFI
jgi:hypothetical protein